ncbi:hypothetical protein DICSQDRAFT_138548 [Dichomitus squalens LYAD-421 SS1]|uniref:Uncharacterized protein n=2 Tax=Dichomitus squalens TaxID=114155 RepID=A0A4Q9MGW5_9APHY|nr:uncharacterized protein DICSQDRAFT_138548 [Dichomitus squalens LYAD-421 SS1]EJF59420.1 hypothetical protein DICSQDRAFT_138548 [Dichomitus squalens LYAD-421 SS1]TBU26694.1 hypothetical protein BD311DRAFT_761998 [Dichomitus squalens]
MYEPSSNRPRHGTLHANMTRASITLVSGKGAHTIAPADHPQRSSYPARVSCYNRRTR